MYVTSTIIPTLNYHNEVARPAQLDHSSSPCRPLWCHPQLITSKQKLRGWVKQFGYKRLQSNIIDHNMEQNLLWTHWREANRNYYWGQVNSTDTLVIISILASYSHCPQSKCSTNQPTGKKESALTWLLSIPGDATDNVYFSMSDF